MTARRRPNDPKAFVRPPALPLVEMATAVRLLPRLRCGACRARLEIVPPTIRPGRLVCRDCGRDYNEIVGEIAPTVSVEAMEPVRRGRPPKVPVASPHVLCQTAYRERLRTGETVKARWARDYDRCVRCNSTESDHNGRGFCNRCKDTARRERLRSEAAS